MFDKRCAKVKICEAAVFPCAAKEGDESTVTNVTCPCAHFVPVREDTAGEAE